MGSVELSSESVEVATVDVKEAKALIESGYVYLDVRTVEEFNKGHVEAEKIFNIPYVFFTPEGRVQNPEFLKQVSAVCKEEDQTLVGCKSGLRSLHASVDLLNAGYKNISNVGGGYLAWVENKFSIKIEKEQKTEL